jgi:hypothetical protein
MAVKKQRPKPLKRSPRWIPLDGKGKPCDPRNATGYAIDPRDKPVHR